MDIIKKFVRDFYNDKIDNWAIVRLVEDVGISVFFRELYLYLYVSLEENEANFKYVHISQAYHKSKIYFDEHS
jgi:hypothetical protein